MLTKEITKYALKHQLRARCEYQSDGTRIYSLADYAGGYIELGGRTFTTTPKAFLAAMKFYVRSCIPSLSHAGGECWLDDRSQWCDNCEALARREEQQEAMLSRRIFADWAQPYQSKTTEKTDKVFIRGDDIPMNETDSRKVYAEAQYREAVRNIKTQTRPVDLSHLPYAQFKTRKEAEAHASERGWKVEKVGLHWFSERPRVAS